MTDHALYDFTITVVPPAGTAPSVHTVRATTASNALAAHDASLTGWGIAELQGVARVMTNSTVYIAAPKNPKPVARAPEPDPKTGIQMW